MFDYKKIPHFNLIPIIIVSLLLYKIINNIGHLSGLFSSFLSIISYFIWAFAIAYLLNPIMVFIEKKLKIKRIWSITLIYVVFLGALSIILTFVTPGLVSSMIDFMNKFPTESEKWIKSFNKYQAFDKYGIFTYLKENLNTIIDKAQSIVPSSINIIVSKLINVTSAMFTLLTGLIISVYLLKDKEAFINSIKRFIKIVLPAKAEDFIEFSNKVNNIFSKYLVGKLIDSLIMGFLCFIGLAFIKTPYALLFSLLFGVLNMIPYFGNFVATIPICLITFFYSPACALITLIFLIVLQQIDGWFIAPKILGGKIGLSPFWVILGITLGGGTFGVLGMFLGVPVMAVVKMMLEDFMDYKEKYIAKTNKY